MLIKAPWRDRIKSWNKRVATWSRSKPVIIRTIRYGKRLLITIAVLCVTFFVLNRVFPLPDKIEYSTIITDSKGEVVHAFLTSDQKWRMKTELEEISPVLR